MNLTELEAGWLHSILVMWLFCWGKWCLLWWYRRWIHARNSCLICAIFIKIKPPQIEVELVKIILWWNRSWITYCPMPRFPLAHICLCPNVFRPNGRATKRRRPNGKLLLQSINIRAWSRKFLEICIEFGLIVLQFNVVSTAMQLFGVWFELVICIDTPVYEFKSADSSNTTKTNSNLLNFKRFASVFQTLWQSIVIEDFTECHFQCSLGLILRKS